MERWKGMTERGNGGNIESGVRKKRKREEKRKRGKEGKEERTEGSS